MKRRLFSVVVVLTLVASLVPAAALAVDYRALQPGETVTFEQKVPINIVLLGYEKGAVDTNALLAELPDSYSPLVRYPQFYGLPGRDMGLEFDFKYRVNFTGNRLENRFFNFLEDIGTEGDPTLFQQQYNDQVGNVLDVAGPVLYIDAPKVEGWLGRNLGIGHKGYTVVLVNWYSRPDFRFHVYTKTDEPDPDTGYNFGEIRESRKVIAWGGTNHRLWFYDLSAGPEAWTDNWNVDDPDLDGNGAEDYRMPPIWEYATGGYRAPSTLSSDLGMVTRFVGINLLFTTSPLYDPMVTAPGVGGRKVVHISMLEDDPASLGTDWIDTRIMKHEFARFQPYHQWRVRLTDWNPIPADFQRALRIFAGVLEEDDCWNAFGDPFAELFCFVEENRDTYIPDYRAADYVLGMFAFNTTAANLGAAFGLLGFADDNWVDGTQSYVFEFDAAEYRELGYGFTTTSIHEGGHHFGMSHPHDGYDSELGIDYGPSDEFYFAWSGDESHTIMAYLDLTREFGKFDRANVYRYEMAGYLNWANGLLDDILAHPDAGSVRAHLKRAEDHARDALSAFSGWRYRSAAAQARKAYVQVAIAADKLGIETPDQAIQRLARPSGAAPHEGDPIRFPDN